MYLSVIPPQKNTSSMQKRHSECEKKKCRQRPFVRISASGHALDRNMTKFSLPILLYLYGILGIYWYDTVTDTDVLSNVTFLIS